MNYFLAPRSGEKSYKNYESTIKNGVPLERIQPHLNEEGLQKVTQEDVIYAWGNREGTSSAWKKMESGDTVIFYAKKELVMVAEVYFKQQSPSLALAMWPPDENGNPWEYTFFLKNLKYIKIPIKTFNLAVGYKPNNIVQGFTYLNPDRISLLNRQYGTVEDFINSFETSDSDEMPDDNEKLYVNVSKDVEPTVRDNISLNPKSASSELSTKTGGSPKKVDHEKRQRSNALTGSKGEVLVLEYEQRKLTTLGKVQLANKVKRVSVDDDSLGYDIQSFDQNGNTKYIEVKSSGSKANDIRFFMSASEMKKGKSLTNYYVYFVDGVNTKTPRITIIDKPFSENKFLVSTETYLMEATVNS